MFIWILHDKPVSPSNQYQYKKPDGYFVQFKHTKHSIYTDNAAADPFSKDTQEKVLGAESLKVSKSNKI